MTQLELAIFKARNSVALNHELVEHIIRLYGDELNKANNKLHVAAELALCLGKYQARYHGAPQAKALWDRSCNALLQWSGDQPSLDLEAHKVRAESTPS